MLIERWTVPAAPATADYQILARYDYNGVHQRSRKLAYINAAGQVVAGGPTAQERVYVHNAAWQAVAEIIDDDRPTSGSQANLTTDRIVHQFFGMRGVNDALIRREDRGVYHPAAEEVDPVTEEPTGTIIPAYHDPADGIFDNWIAQLSDAQGSIVKTVAAKTGTHGVTPEKPMAAGQTIDEIEYDPYGRSRRHFLGDFNHDGEYAIDDIVQGTGQTDAYFAGSPSADQDDNGLVETTDILTFLNDWFRGADGPADSVSNAYTDNPYGYCGYYFDVETLGINGPDTGAFYHVRHRVYDPASGRWLTRDPAGFVDGVNLYLYYGFDPFGLCANPDPEMDDIRKQMKRSPDDPPILTPEEQKNSEKTAEQQQQMLDEMGRPIKAVAETAAGFVPGVGEVMDAKTVADSEQPWYVRLIAGVSLLANGLTGGIAPNFGGAAKVASEAVDAASDAGRAGRVAENAADAATGVARKGDELVDLASSQRRKHILDGDGTGGGHRAGTGIPGKSEFPGRWSDDEVMHYVSDVATDPKSAVSPGRGGKQVIRGNRDGVDIEVIYDPRKGEIITAYPTNAPRNPPRGDSK